MVPSIRNERVSRSQRSIRNHCTTTSNIIRSVREPRVTSLVSGFAPLGTKGVQIVESSTSVETALRFSVDPATGAQSKHTRSTITTIPEHEGNIAASSSSMENLTAVQKRFPNLSKSVIERFEKQNGKEQDEKLIQCLEDYVQFRKMYNLDSSENGQAEQNDNDAADWAWASKVAIHAAKNVKSQLLPGVEGCGTFEERICNLSELPQMIFCPQYEDGSYVFTKAGNPVVHLLPALIDIKLVSADVYTLCCNLYIERKAKHIDFHSLGAAVVGDARVGQGWPNLPVFHIMGFLLLWIRALQRHQPGCMTKLVVFNIRYVAVGIFNMTKPLIPKSIADNTHLVSGGDALKDVVSKKLAKFVPEAGIKIMEETRFSMFRE